MCRNSHSNVLSIAINQKRYIDVSVLDVKEVKNKWKGSMLIWHVLHFLFCFMEITCTLKRSLSRTLLSRHDHNIPCTVTLHIFRSYVHEVILRVFSYPQQWKRGKPEMLISSCIWHFKRLELEHAANMLLFYETSSERSFTKHQQNEKDAVEMKLK